MGKDKIFLHIYDGVTFIEYLYKKACAYFERVIISSGNEIHGEKIRVLLPEAEIVSDLFCGKGPMGGLVSVFQKTGADRFAVVPADVPLASMEVLSFLLAQCGQACMIREDGFTEPLIAAYGKETLLRMERCLSEDNCKIMAAVGDEAAFYSFEELKAAIPPLQDKDLKAAFTNINTEQDYQDLLK